MSDFGQHIPDDDYVHVADLSCGCGPYIVAIPGFGGGVAHRAIHADPVPDTLPAGWDEWDD